MKERMKTRERLTCKKARERERKKEFGETGQREIGEKGTNKDYDDGVEREIGRVQDREK